MDNSMFLLMDILVAGCGVYILYAFYLMKFKGEVKDGLFLSKDVLWKKCKDQQAYIAYMAPKALIMGIATLVCGVIGLLNDYFDIIGWQIYLGITGVFFVIVIWFAVMIRKSVKLFW